MPEKTEKKAEQRSGFIAYAEFTFADKAYKAGDIFAPPAGVARDPEPLQSTAKRRAAPSGVAFVTNGKRVILPVQEA